MAPRRGINYVVPALNPLSRYENALDTTAPVIGGLTIRRNFEDVLGNTRESGAGYGPTLLDEQRRTNSYYFGNTVRVGQENAPWVGERATATSGTSDTKIGGGNGVLDLVLRAHDTFGTQQNPSTHRVGLYRAAFTITGRSHLATSGYIPAIDFSQISPVRVPDDIGTVNTRSIYENDWKNNTVTKREFNYIVTNTPLTPGANGDVRDFDTRPHNLGAYNSFAWSTRTRTGSAWNGTTTAASGNDDSQFPDDIYNIRVWAYDESGNVTERTFPVLVDNWLQTVVTDKDTYTANEPVDLNSGVGYLADQSLPV